MSGVSKNDTGAQGKAVEVLDRASELVDQWAEDSEALPVAENTPVDEESRPSSAKGSFFSGGTRTEPAPAGPAPHGPPAENDDHSVIDLEQGFRDSKEREESIALRQAADALLDYASANADRPEELSCGQKLCVFGFLVCGFVLSAYIVISVFGLRCPSCLRCCSCPGSREARASECRWPCQAPAAPMSRCQAPKAGCSCGSPAAPGCSCGAPDAPAESADPVHIYHTEVVEVPVTTVYTMDANAQNGRLQTLAVGGVVGAFLGGASFVWILVVFAALLAGLYGLWTWLRLHKQQCVMWFVMK